MVANDAGGLRMIDISDKENPVEIGKYVNMGIEDIAQSAYNNIVIVDHYAYIAVDMCGLMLLIYQMKKWKQFIGLIPGIVIAVIGLADRVTQTKLKLWAIVYCLFQEEILNC